MPGRESREKGTFLFFGDKARGVRWAFARSGVRMVRQGSGSVADFRGRKSVPSRRATQTRVGRNGNLKYIERLRLTLPARRPQFALPDNSNAAPCEVPSDASSCSPKNRTVPFSRDSLPGTARRSELIASAVCTAEVWMIVLRGATSQSKRSRFGSLPIGPASPPPAQMMEMLPRSRRRATSLFIPVEVMHEPVQQRRKQQRHGDDEHQPGIQREEPRK